MSRILCLLYHRVNEYSDDMYDMSVSPQNFEEHMRYLKERYQIAKFDDNWAEISGDAVVITFDDGYMDNYKFAVPILQKYQIPATIFITTGNIGTDNEFWWDELERLLLSEIEYKEQFELWDEVYHYNWKTDSLKKRCDLVTTLRWLLRCDPYLERRNSWIEQLRTWSGLGASGRSANLSMKLEQIKELSDSSLITIGGHTVNHQSLGSLGYANQENEISTSIDFLKEITGKEITTYSYPFGKGYDYSEDTFQILRKYGIQKSATTETKACTGEEHLLAIPRVTVKDVKINEFARLIEQYI